MHRSIPAVLVTAVCCGAVSEGLAAEAATAGAAVVTRTEVLWPEGAPGALGTAEADRPELTVTLPPAGRATGAAMVVCPGGGYSVLMMTYEGHDIARWLNEHGMAAIVLRYRVKPYPVTQSVADGKRAMRLVRTRAKDWGLDPTRLGMIGFSAGGHLAMSWAPASTPAIRRRPTWSSGPVAGRTSWCWSTPRPPSAAARPPMSK